MITSNSTHLHRVDTLSGRGDWTNLNHPATAPGPLMGSDFAYLDETPTLPPSVRSAPRRLSLLKVLRRAVLAPIYEYKMRCIREERESYQAAPRAGARPAQPDLDVGHRLLTTPTPHRRTT